jgi:hypothetical protein
MKLFYLHPNPLQSRREFKVPKIALRAPLAAGAGKPRGVGT